MALTPIEVENTQFRVAFRGYAIDEVDAFLDRVQGELARLLSEQAPASTPLATAPATGTEGQEAALRTLLLAQRTADAAAAGAGLVDGSDSSRASSACTRSRKASTSSMA